jgi:S1-C subfamily serine protease
MRNRVPARFLLLLTSVGALVAAGCGGDDPSDGTGTTSSAVRPDPMDAMVWIKTMTPMGERTSTGFIWAADRGLVLTSVRAVEGAQSEPVVYTERGRKSGHIKARAQCHDLALVQLHPVPPGLSEIRLAATDGVEAGDKVRTLAYAASSAEGELPQLAQLEGAVQTTQAKVELHHLLPKVSPLIAYDAPVTAAYEGGPVLNERNEAIGINVLTGEHHGTGPSTNAEYALQTDWFTRQLREHLKESTNPADEHDVVWSGWRAEHKRCHHQMERVVGLPEHQHTKGQDAHGHGRDHGDAAHGDAASDMK